MTQDELNKVTQDVIAELKKNGTNIAEASVVSDISQVNNLVAYGKNGKVIKVTPQTIQESVVTNSSFINFNKEYPDVTSCTKQDVINRILSDGRVVPGMVVVYNDSQTFLRTIMQYIGFSTSPSLASTSKYWVNVGDKYSEWDSGFSLNSYIDKGVYHFRGVRNPDEDEGFPTDWGGAFAARLEVINGYDDICSQTLTLTEQGKTALYTRTRIDNAWSDWVEIGGGGESSYTLPIATTDTLGGVKSYPREGECYSDLSGVQYAVVVGGSGLAHVTLPYASSSQYGVVRVDGSVNENSNNPVSGKAVANAIANISGGDVDMDALLAEAEKRALRKLYIAAGAEYNDTEQIIKKTAFWGEEVDHLPKHYYLNGLGDITEEQMMEIYNTKDYISIIVSGYSSNVSRIFQDGSCPRTFKGVISNRFLESKTLNTGGAPIFSNSTIEVVKWSGSKNVSSYNNSFKLGQSIFYSCKSLRVIERCAITHAKSFALCSKLEFFEIHGLATDFDISASPSVKKTSIIYTINNVLKTTTKSLVITLHADVYSKCIEGGEWYEEVQSALTTANEAITGGGNINIVSA